MLLAIDTATGTASVALFGENGVLGESTWRIRENHTRSLMPEIVRLLELCSVRVEELRALGVTTGPGSFTGLRIGLSLAKGLALSLRIPLVGIPTLDVSAWAFSQQPFPIWAILEAGRGRFAGALYLAREHSVERVTDYTFGTPQVLAAKLKTNLAQSFDGAHFDSKEKVLVTGESTGALIESLQSELGDRIVSANEAVRLRRAGYLAELAWQRWQQNELDNLETLAPFYIPTASLG